MSDTPRTDAAIYPVVVGPVVSVSFARQLERELAAATGSNIQKPQPELAILDVINALRPIIIALHHSAVVHLNTQDTKDLLNLLADAEAKLQLP